MDHFSEIRSLVQTAQWDKPLVRTLKRLCLALIQDEPRLWVTQVAPYIASFQDKWDAYEIPVTDKTQLRAYVALFPYAWFCYTPYTSRYPVRFLKDEPLFTRVRTLDLRSTEDSSYKRTLTFLKYFLNLHTLKLPSKVPYRPFSQRLAGLTSCPPLKTLSLPDNRVTNEDLISMAQLGFFKELRHLDLSINQSLSLLPFEDMPKLESLNLKGTLAGSDDYKKHIPTHIELA